MEKALFRNGCYGNTRSIKMFGKKRKVLSIGGVGAIGTFDQCKCSKKKKSSFSTSGCYGNIRSMKLFEKKKKSSINRSRYYGNIRLMELIIKKFSLGVDAMGAVNR